MPNQYVVPLQLLPTELEVQPLRHYYEGLCNPRLVKLPPTISTGDLQKVQVQLLGVRLNFPSERLLELIEHALVLGALPCEQEHPTRREPAGYT